MSPSTEKAADPYADLQVGDNVKHSKFGEGAVMQRSGSGDKTKLIVAFAEEGQKHLLARYAKLKKVQPIDTSEKEDAPEAAVD